ncbi:hypothetical protein Hbl1158_12585 [Halobaculum sp. CBA1158]|uniref:DNA methyltransferase n=1 Tax=Halobaculum sp. CBA1158 TaxID=2904243 RepID=UPI001F3AAC70|nr:DNA methyltransferase [Halobaculum sp. CBA1158]UIO99355.1 hypothetical protein Hbl1158_12585 [Halobaculum sp. CBA1158]
MVELEDITTLPGFGPSKVDNFRDAGYRSLEDLRGITWDELGEINGIKSAAKRRALLNFLEEHDLRETPETEENYERFRSLLEELFQFESADLDFGVYRILNARRDRIEEFLDEELERTVKAELDAFRAAERGPARERLDAVVDRIAEDFPQWLDENGTVDETALPEDPQGIAEERMNAYLEAKAEAERAEIGERTEAAIYQDLYRFFNRYYEDGDFVPQRRAANQEKYAIPYNGEEVKLHWANRDQYLVKTGERFSDYRFREDSYEVEFSLHDASVEPSNRKGDERYFVLRAETPVEQDGRRLTVHFEYRPLRDDDYDDYDLSEGSRTKARDLQARIETRILSGVSSQLEGVLDRETDDAYSDSTVLQKHLRNYRTRNEEDYFIHKDLRGFLERELDFYLKNEVFSWRELTDDTGEIPAHVRARIEAIENIAGEILEFVSEIEEFQKRLYEKKKFVVDTEYCVTLDNVPEELYPEILENEGQLNEWESLFGVEREDGMTEDDLRERHGLVLDTKHFDEEFRYAVLSSFDDIAERTDGIAVNGENFQALRLLEATFEDQVDSVYIDPPYNTGEDDFVFKDDFADSSWLSMMNDRLDLGFDLMKPSGTLLCHIDEHELSELHRLLTENYGEENNLGEIVWNKRNPKGDAGGVATQHEYVFSWTNSIEEFKSANGFVRLKENAEAMRNKADSLFDAVQRSEITLEEANSRYQDWIRNNESLSGGERAYKYIDEEGRIYRPTSMAWPNKNDPPDDYRSDLVHPKTGEPCKKPKRGWRFPSDSLAEMQEGTLRERADHLIKGEIVFGHDHTTIPNRKTLLEGNVVENLPSVLSYGGSADALFTGLGLTFDDNPKPLEISKRLLEPALLLSDPDHTVENPLVLDFFAGSGTTGDTAITLEREFDTDIDYILVEMGDHFDEVLLPRIKKRVFSSTWTDGVPQTEDSIGHVVRYHRLESYDDTLDNLDVDEGQASIDSFTPNTLEYLLRFGVDGPSLLDLAGLKDPFDYEIDVRNGDESRTERIDLVETFNYLLGLRVETVRTFEEHGRKYRVVNGQTDGKSAVIVWRPVSEDDGADFFEAERAFLNATVLDDEDLVYVNYDCAVADAKSIENAFQNRMWD